MISADDSALMEAEIAAIIEEEQEKYQNGALNEKQKEIQSEVVEIEQNTNENVLSQTLVVEEVEAVEAVKAVEAVEVVNVQVADEMISIEQELVSSERVEPVESTEQTIAESTTAHIELLEDSNDGPRAKHLKQALKKALNNTIKSCR
jgi:hypothetical protein